MSIEIEVMNGEAGWPRVKPLMDLVWTPEVLARMGSVQWGRPDLRVMVDDEHGEVAAHVGLSLRDGTWKGRKARLGGIGDVTTHPASRQRGYASVALDAAIQTFRHHEAIDFVLLFCEDHLVSFYEKRRWHRFPGQVFAEQSGKHGPFTGASLTPMVFDFAMRPRDGVIDLCGLPW